MSAHVTFGITRRPTAETCALLAAEIVAAEVGKTRFRLLQRSASPTGIKLRRNMLLTPPIKQVLDIAAAAEGSQTLIDGSLIEPGLKLQHPVIAAVMHIVAAG